MAYKDPFYYFKADNSDYRIVTRKEAEMRAHQNEQERMADNHATLTQQGMKVNGRTYNSIAEVNRSKDTIKEEVQTLIAEAQLLQHAINDMNSCNYQNNCTNQPEQY